ncbi:pyridoxal-phosphate dependent enzyme [Nocardiopsis lambiniae]|uniref:Pyridoxal-phosphate dependent enzyme n=1 Tax=Nocardiopsis lambiniae TaxID=3075539 RepID=A0ABU2MDH2_9ACTN|nr:pyridoxal-phosphate dependent enzyme [Nocardiopsis sp. DSM 44743]MDT0330610.1 pyridoxal-phosphate dependent enzyme [Nocardiopsis sp. DSM 44743]
MHEHYADAIADPDCIRLAPDLVCLRFEVMKVRSALGAVRHLLDTGAVRPGDTLVDSSSGIYALALALACHRYGMRCHIVGSSTVDETLRVQLEVLGATLEQMPPSDDLMLDQNRRVERVGRLLLENPGFHWMRQYHDAIHYVGYREVAEQLDREVPTGPLTIVSGVGTGSSTGALGCYLRAAGRDVELVGIQPFGSVTFNAEHTADPDMIIAGIGSSIEFRNVRHELYDRIHWVSFEYARAGAVALLRDSGVFAGLSAGAAYLAAGWEGGRTAGRTVVFLAPDTGHRYVRAAFAAHAHVPGIADLSPHEVADSDGIALPWSVADRKALSASWRDPVPVAARAPSGSL